MPAQESITLLHVSDPQFGRNHRFGNLGDDDSLDTLFGRLDLDLRQLTEEGVTPQLLMVSGDLVETGLRSEFTDAALFLELLADRLKLARENVVIVPGNHDVNRKLCQAYFDECEGDELQPKMPYGRKWKPFLSMFEQFYGSESRLKFTVEEPWTFWECSDLNVVVAGLNSTMKESHRDEDHYGWVGEAQLRWFRNRLAPYVERGWLRIGVVHHNLDRGAAADDENLRDSDDLRAILGASLNLVLHGHTHDAKTAWLGPALPVISTGSAALSANARPDEVPNQYQAVRVWPDRLERWTRRYDPAQKRWIGDTRCSPRGDSWHLVDRVSFSQVQAAFTSAGSGELQDDHPRPGALRDARPDSFTDRVAEICQLRISGQERLVDVEPIRDETGLEYLRVRISEHGLARVYPIGIVQSGLSEAIVARFVEQVFEPYRQYDRALRCALVYGGERASDELISQAARANVLVHSFLEFQGVVDFRGYVGRQTAKLASDVIYPPHLYVPQRLAVEIGGERTVSSDAVADSIRWLAEPLARLILVLGDFGAGKTFFLHELARRLPDELPHLVPILIELRNLEKASTLMQLVAQHLAAAGERHIDLEAFPYMLREGRVALLFDGFDELAQRVTYKRAADHFDTLLQAVDGRAKVVITSRTQHFESDVQVHTALRQRAYGLSGLHTCRVQPFDDTQIEAFLAAVLDDRSAAVRRFELIREIRDLLGLAHNPRMLTFIASLPESELLEARERTGAISSADLYRLLIERWLRYEHGRGQSPGAAPTLTIGERWNAATALALHMWPKLDRSVRLSELHESVSKAVGDLTDERMLDAETATHVVGSATLLVRDAEGTFAFVHQSVMEWLVANHAAQELKAGAVSKVLLEREITPLMVDFLCALASEELAREWAGRALQGDDPRGKANALLVLQRLGVDVDRVSLAGQVLSGASLAGRRLVGADLAAVDLTEARLEGVDLTGADLTRTVFERANLTGASLRSARMDRTRASRAILLGADLRDATLSEVDLRTAKLVGARLSTGALEGCDTLGAALPGGRPPQPMTARASAGEALAWRSDGELMATAHDGGAITVWDCVTGAAARVLGGGSGSGSVNTLAFAPDGMHLVSGGNGGVQVWDVCTGGRVLLAIEQPSSEVIAAKWSGGRLYLATGDGSLLTWDVFGGRQMRHTKVGGRFASAATYARDAELVTIASRGGIEQRRTTDEEVVWRVESPLTTNVLACSPDGSRLATAGGRSSEIYVWGRVFGLEALGHRVIGSDERVASLDFSADGFVAVASRTGSIRVLDATTGSELWWKRHPGLGPRSVSFSPDGTTLAVVTGQGVTLREAKSGREVGRLTSGARRADAVALSTDYDLVSADFNGQVTTWSLPTGRSQVRERYRESVVLALSSDGRRIAELDSVSNMAIREVATGEVVWKGGLAAPYAAAFSCDGALFAYIGRDTNLRILTVASGETQDITELRSPRRLVTSMVFSPNADLLAFIASEDRVEVWDLSSGEEAARFAATSVRLTAIAFSSNGARMAVGADDGVVRLWKPGEGGGPRRLWRRRAQDLAVLAPKHEHLHSVTAVAFAHDGDMIAAGHSDGRVDLWFAAPDVPCRSLVGYHGSAEALAFSSDGKILAVAGPGGNIVLWNVDTTEALATFIASTEGAAAFAPDGRYRVQGQLGGAFWYAMGLCRFEPTEIDEFLPHGELQRIDHDEQLVEWPNP